MVGRKGFCSSLKLQNQRREEKGVEHNKFFSMTMDIISIQEASDLSSRLEDKFACLSGSTSQGVWYIDSGASTHMTGVREYFSSYKEEQMDLQITMGNKTKCTPVGRGTIEFQMEARTNIQATNVLHVSRLGMNLISVSQL